LGKTTPYQTSVSVLSGERALKTLQEYLRGLTSDHLFLRICMLLWGVPLASFSAVMGWSVAQETSGSPDVFLIAVLLLLAVIGLMGTALTMAAIFGSDSRVEKTGELMNANGEAAILLLAIVVIVAVPLTILARLVRRG
jgi:hypothetical protein